LPLPGRRSGCRAQPDVGRDPSHCRATCLTASEARCSRPALQRSGEVRRRSPWARARFADASHQLRRNGERRAQSHDDGDHFAVVMARDDRLGRRGMSSSASTT
jgi:hypothetical protein